MLAFAFASNILLSSAHSPLVEAPAVYKRALATAASANDQIWPGYDLKRYARLQPGGDGIVLSPDPDNADEPIKITIDNNWFHKHTLPQGVSITFHEGFHSYQNKSTAAGETWLSEKPADMPYYTLMTPPQMALFRIEATALRKALFARNVAEKRSFVRDFLQVREYRHGSLPSKAIAYEEGGEHNEGMAEYAGTRGAVLSLSPAERQQYLRTKFERLRTITTFAGVSAPPGAVDSNARTWLYLTGPAEGLLLDDLLRGWKHRVQDSNAVLTKLLQEAVSFRARPSSVNGILRRYGYGNLLKDEQGLASVRRQGNRKKMEAVLGQKGTRLVIDASNLGAAGAPKGIDPLNLAVLDEAIRIHQKFVMLNAGPGLHAMFQQGVVQNAKIGTYTTVVPEGTILKLVIDGSDQIEHNSGRVEFAHSLAISTPKINIQCEGRGWLDIKDREITVHTPSK